MAQIVRSCFYELKEEISAASWSHCSSDLLDTFSHQSINVKLIISGRLEELLVACQVVIENRSVVHHAAERVIDYGDLDTMCQQFDDSAVNAELAELLGGRSDEDVAPVQIAMLEFELSFGNGES